MLQGICWAALAAGLLAAAVMDQRTKSVYNIIFWWCALAAGGLLWIKAATSYRMGGFGLSANLRGAPEGILGDGMLQTWVGLALFLLLQETLFATLYGRADSHGFCVCAIAGTTLGWDFLAYLIHMSAALGALFVVQLLRRNVTITGRLREPVAFLPYIVGSFFAFIFLKEVF